VQYELDGEYEEMDFHELMQVLVMGKQFGDPKVQWGKTQAEVIEEIKVEALAKQKKEVVHYAMTERIDEVYERWYDGEKVYRTENQVVGDGTMEVPVPVMSVLKSEVVYDDEPKNQMELERHPEKPMIISSTQK
jgi:cyclophilin family peptidyl-prolyl cis-trans isomerase